MINRIINVIPRALAVILIGFVSAVIGSIIVVNIGYGFAPDFTYNGWEGYEAMGPIGFVLGALIGLVASSVLLFRKQRKG